MDRRTDALRLIIRNKFPRVESFLHFAKDPLFSSVWVDFAPNVGVVSAWGTGTSGR